MEKKRKAVATMFVVMFIVSLMLPVAGLAISLAGNLTAGSITAHAMFPLGAVSILGMVNC